jgi:hypothetical protein
LRGARLIERGLGLPRGIAHIRVVDRRDDRALSDHLAFVHEHLSDSASHLRGEGQVAARGRFYATSQ